MTLQAGTRLGAYEILSRLGAGGMGEVYRARDGRLDRDVAVKVLPAAVANDPDALSRFEREAKAVAALSHPNILSIFDFGRHQDVAYVVTELLEGDTLRGKLDAGPVSQRQSVDYGLQIAKGLSAAHERGIVHRDLKPENVFVTRDGHVKILDFGLAKRVEAAKPGEVTEAPTVDGQTEPGKVMGTVGYMSPEQARGLPVDHRSDIFSLGAILYELFSGRRAFKKDTPGDTLAAIIRDEPPELTETGRNVSPALDHIVKHCLEKDRDNRFQSAKDIAFALSEASGPTTVTSGMQVVAAPARAKTSRLRLALGLLVLVAVALGVFLMRRGPGSPAAGGVKRVAVLPFENLGAAEDDYIADGIADAVRGKLTSVSGLEVIARASSTPYKKTTKTAQEIARELGAHYLLTATVRWQKGGGANRVQVSPELVEVRESGAPAARWQQPFDAAVTDVFQVQSDIASQVAQALGVALEAGQEKQLAERRSKSLPAYEAFLKGEEAAAGLSKRDPPSLRKALAFYEQAVALDPLFAQAWARIAYASSVLYFTATATPELSERARRAAETAISLAPNDPESHSAMGTYKKVVLADYRAAQEHFARGMSLAPGNADLMGDAATVEASLGQRDAALKHLRDAQRLDPRSVSVNIRLGRALLWLRRYPEARQTMDAGLALSPDNLSLIENRAMTFLGEGNVAGARASLASLPGSVEPTELVAFLTYYWDLGWVLTEEQKEILLRLTPAAFDEDRGNWAICLAQVLWWRGNAVQARKYAEEARKAVEEQLQVVPDDPMRHAGLGLALAYLGRGEEAIREGQRAVELGPVTKDADTGTYYLHQLVRIYALAGQPEKAIDNLERLLKMPYFVSPAWLKIDPNFGPLRNNPRFQKLVAKANA